MHVFKSKIDFCVLMHISQIWLLGLDSDRLYTPDRNIVFAIITMFGLSVYSERMCVEHWRLDA